jgi:WD40 repeat protein
LNGGKVRFYGGGDGTVQLWAAPRARPGAPEGAPVLMRTLGRHKGRVTAAAVSARGRYLVSGDENGGVKAWDIERPQLSRELEPKVQAALRQLSSDPSNAEARSTLDRWFEFRGRGVIRP